MFSNPYKLSRKIITYLLIVILGKDYKIPKKNNPVNKKYPKLWGDQKSGFENIKKLEFNKLLDDYLKANGKELKLIKT